MRAVWPDTPVSESEVEFIRTDLAGVTVVRMTPIEDDRGYFARTWCRDEFEEAGLGVDWVQSNLGVSEHRLTLRGLHLQTGADSEWKLVRCTRGRVFDVAVDLRPGSDSYLGWFGVELSDDSKTSLLIPPGCAHGYLTLEPWTHLEYLTSARYAPASATGVRFDDAAFGVEWPARPMLISEQDRNWPSWEPNDGRAHHSE